MGLEFGVGVGFLSLSGSTKICVAQNTFNKMPFIYVAG